MVEVIKFSASWCGPCKMLAPIIDGIKHKYPSVTFTDIDVDQNMDAAASYGVRGVPHVIIKKDGKVVDRITGVNTSQFFENKINSLI